MVPPKPVEYRLLRRKKVWKCGLAAIALALLTVLFAVDRLTSEAPIPISWLVGCAALTCVSGTLALVFRSKEQPSEIIIRDWPGEPPVIH